MDIREEVIWALGVIAGFSEQSQHVIIDSGCVESLIEDLSNEYSGFKLSYITWM